MARKSRKRLGLNEKDKSGCIRSLINNIFDFRPGRSSQKLLQDKKHESKRMAGAAYPDIALESLNKSCEICKEFTKGVQSETSITDAGKMSVKELMEEDMIGEPDKKRQGTNVITEAEQIATDDGAHVQKNHRRTRSMTSLNLRPVDFAAGEGSVAGKPSHRRHKSLSSVYLNVMVEELCSQISHKDSEAVTLPIEDPSVIEEELWEAARVLISQFADGKNVTKDGKIQASKELVHALRIIDSNKDVFLSLLQDPNSQLVKKIQTMEDVKLDEGKFKVVMDSHLFVGQGIWSGRQQSFFWRRFKGLERSPPKKNDISEDLNKIVVLKPGPSVSGNSETTSPCGSLPESPRSMGEKQQINRVFSTLSFSEFKRKLKHVMRKEQNGVVQNSMSRQPSDEQLAQGNRDKRFGGETVLMASPSRDHFFIERIPKSSVSVKKVDKTGKLNDEVINLQNGTSISPEQRVSNIYVEAKKHLAEIIGNNNLDGDTSRRQVPRSLGRLMSFSGYPSPTPCSPKKEGEMMFSSNGKCQTDEKTCQVKQESGSEPCVAADEPICEVEVSPLQPISDGVPCENSVDKPDKLEVRTSEDIVRSPDVESQEENKLIESTSEQIDSPSSSKCSEEKWSLARLEQDSCAVSEPSSSQIASTLDSVTVKGEDRELVSDATSKPSPVSVLEPLFTEDDISPRGINSISVTGPVQPQQLRFEEEISAPSQRYARYRTYIEDESHTFNFVRAVVTMSGLTWDELQRRTLFSDHLIDPSLLDEIDFLPDLLPCDFNLLFDLINEVVIEISWLYFGCMIRFAQPSVHPKLKDKDIFTETWKGVDWYLKLEGGPRTLDEIVGKDLAKSGLWMNLCPDTETIGIQLQEAILEELVEGTILSCLSLI